MECNACGSDACVASRGECSLESANWHVEAVLGPEYTAPVRTVNALVGVIVDRRHTSRLVQELQHLSPIPSLRHLKRVCPDGRILIRLVDDSNVVDAPNKGVQVLENIPVSTSSCGSLLGKCKKDAEGRKRSFEGTIANRLSPDIEQSDVTESQSVNNECDLPVKDLSEEVSPSRVETGSNISENEQQTLHKKYNFPAGLNTEGLCSALKCVPVPATAPLTRAQFAEAQRIWSCNFHPTRTVEAALSPGAGLETEERELLYSALGVCLVSLKTANSNCAAAAVDPEKGIVLAFAMEMKDVHPLQHAVMRLIDIVARMQGGGVWPACSEKEIVRDIRSSNRGSRNGVGYLCTGLDIVMTHEPCAMCAMALTHARAHRVFFSEDNPDSGVLYSRPPLLHTLPGLNHRLRVFRSPLPKELKELYG